MATTRRFSAPTLQGLSQNKILGMRAGSSPHRFIGIWVVVAKGRVFVRSWDRATAGWFHALRREPVGVIQVGDREIRIRASFPRSEAVRDMVDHAYAAKYTTPGALKFVRGFRIASRRAATAELLPR